MSRELNNEKIAERICACLEQEGMSQRTLTIQIGVKEATFNRYLKGSREIPAVVLGTIADYFDVSVEYLLWGDNPKRGSDEDWKARAVRSEKALKRIKKTLEV